MRSVVRLVILALILGFLVGCSTAARSRPDSSGDSAGASSYEPSLGTAWGERIESRLHYVSFVREDEKRPDAVATIHYDDKAGIRELSGLRRERTRPFTAMNGDIEFGITDEESGVFWSSYLPGIERSGQYYVRGEKGDRYAIYLRNRSDNRIEVVLSVDGVDVINGQSASFERSGYIVDPGEKLVVEGFRDSRNSVAAFRFADVANSYVAEKTGNTTNVGVIGLAVFAERGSYRYASRGRDRSRANPFPGEFATAP